MLRIVNHATNDGHNVGRTLQQDTGAAPDDHVSRAGFLWHGCRYGIGNDWDAAGKSFESSQAAKFRNHHIRGAQQLLDIIRITNDLNGKPGVRSN